MFVAGHSPQTLWVRSSWKELHILGDACQLSFRALQTLSSVEGRHFLGFSSNTIVVPELEWSSLRRSWLTGEAWHRFAWRFELLSGLRDSVLKRKEKEPLTSETWFVNAGSLAWGWVVAFCLNPLCTVSFFYWFLPLPSISRCKIILWASTTPLRVCPILAWTKRKVRWRDVRLSPGQGIFEKPMRSETLLSNGTTLQFSEVFKDTVQCVHCDGLLQAFFFGRWLVFAGRRYMSKSLILVYASS